MILTVILTVREVTGGKEKRGNQYNKTNQRNKLKTEEKGMNMNGLELSLKRKFQPNFFENGP